MAIALQRTEKQSVHRADCIPTCLHQSTASRNTTLACNFYYAWANGCHTSSDSALVSLQVRSSKEKGDVGVQVMHVMQVSKVMVIRESVDSLCRDDADMPMPPYRRKAYNCPNAVADCDPRVLLYLKHP